MPFFQNAKLWARSWTKRIAPHAAAVILAVLGVAGQFVNPASAQETCASLAAAPAHVQGNIFQDTTPTSKFVNAGQVSPYDFYTISVVLNAGDRLDFDFISRQYAAPPTYFSEIRETSPGSNVLVRVDPNEALQFSRMWTAPSSATYALQFSQLAFSGGLIGVGMSCKLAPPGGTLQLIKKTTGGDGTFAFTSVELSNPSLTTVSGTAQTAATSVKAGTYTLAEAAATGWDLSSIACSGNAKAATVNLSNRSVAVPVAANENVVCTFTNTEVKKRTEGIIKTFINHRADLLSRPGRSFIPRLEGDPPVDQPGSLKDDAPEPMKLGQSLGQKEDQSFGSQSSSGAALNSTSPLRGLDKGRGAGVLGMRGIGGNSIDHGAPFGDSRENAGANIAATTASGLPFSGSGDDHNQRWNFATSLIDMQRNAANSEKARMSKLGVNPDDYGAGTGGTSRSRFNIWGEAEINRFDAGPTGASSSGEFNLFSTGLDYVVTPGVLLVGVMAQADDMKEHSSSIGYNISGTGWMAGPYAALRISDHVFVEGRGLWGTSNNSISPFLTYTDSFETERWLASVRVTGSWSYGALQVRPSAEVIKYHEKSDAYTGHNGIAIDGQTADLGRVIFGPQIGYRMTRPDGTVIEPMAALKGIWDFDSEDTFIAGVTIAHDDFRGLVEGGVRVTASNGFVIDLSGNYHGLGASDFESWGGKALVRVPLN